jgi:hypothetical protein
LIVLIGAAVLVAVVLAEASFTFTWATAASNGEQSSARASFDETGVAPPVLTGRSGRWRRHRS